MAFFEVLMLVCFAASWPFSILKAWRTKQVAGKSPVFMWIIEVGYLSGILYKLTGQCDWRVWLYVFNMTIVGVDLGLYYRYRGGDEGTKRRSDETTKRGGMGLNPHGPTWGRRGG